GVVSTEGVPWSSGSRRLPVDTHLTSATLRQSAVGGGASTDHPRGAHCEQVRHARRGRGSVRLLRALRARVWRRVSWRRAWSWPAPREWRGSSVSLRYQSVQDHKDHVDGRTPVDTWLPT